jgi:hypothetical protein
MMRCRKRNIPRGKGENILERFLQNLFAALAVAYWVHWLAELLIPFGPFFSQICFQRAASVVVNYTGTYNSK